jgi:hypothetical protein
VLQTGTGGMINEPNANEERSFLPGFTISKKFQPKANFFYLLELCNLLKCLNVIRPFGREFETKAISAQGVIPEDPDIV